MIRRAGISDTERIYVIEKECIECAWPEEEIRKAVTDDRYVFLVYETDGEIIGCLNASIADGTADINSVYVAGGHRNTGIASSLVKTALSILRAGKTAEIFLEADPENKAAVKLYEKFGFAKISTRKNYYKGGKDADIYRLLL